MQISSLLLPRMLLRVPLHSGAPLLRFRIIVDVQVRHLLARRALPFLKHVESCLHVVTELAELLLQAGHHRRAVLVGAIGQMVGTRLRLVENRTRTLPVPCR